MLKKLFTFLTSKGGDDMKKNIKGFTLVELLVVIGIIAILFAVVLVAINPAKRFAEANNARRLSDINSILNGVLNYTVDQKGSLPAGLKVATANYTGATPRIVGTTVLTGTLACQGIGTCSIKGLGSCSTATDCDNSCNAAINSTGTCKVTGATCTEGAVYAANGALNECGTGAAGTCTANLCVGGPYAGRYCDVAGDCTGGAVGTCTANSVTALQPYNLAAAAEGVVPAYLASMPVDPASTATAPRYYAIENVKGAGRIHVIACTPDDPEGDGLANNVKEVIR